MSTRWKLIIKILKFLMQIYVGDIKTHLNSQKQASERKMLKSQKPLSVPIKIQLSKLFLL